LTSGRQPVVKIIAESLSQYDEKYVIPIPFSGIRVGRRRYLIKKTKNNCYIVFPSDCDDVESRKTFVLHIRRGGQKVKTA
jgi:hypothetical protein